MRTGIVIQKRRKYTIVMDNEGQFHKAEPLNSVEIGAETSFTPKQKSNLYTFFNPRAIINQKTLAAILSLVLLTFPLYALLDGNEVYAYVNIDINPSMELIVNDQMLVEKISPLNEDAEMLLERLKDIKGKSVETATDEIINQSHVLGYTESKRAVLIGISYKKHPKKESRVTEMLDDYFVNNPREDVTIATFEVPEELREEAKNQNKSMNELMATTMDSRTSVLTADEESKMSNEEKELIKTYYSNEEPVPFDSNTDEEQQDKEEEYQELEQEVIDKSNEETDEDNTQSLPPGLDKKEELPPGLEKREELPPGLEKERPTKDRNNNSNSLPPGLEKKEIIPPGIEKKEVLPPGLEKKKEKNLESVGI